jgi:shikimate kinase
MHTKVEKIVLVGFMGTGKSTVAKVLAKQLGFSVRELDAIIIERSGKSSISDIFDQMGETHFRDLESAACAEVSHDRSVVISTGGGVVGRPSNMERLTAEGGIVVFLRTSFDEILARDFELLNRPLFKNQHEARALFEQRTPLYLTWANLTIDTDTKSIEDICAEILSSLHNQERKK